MTTATITRLERRADGVLGGDDALGPEWTRVRAAVLAALVDHPEAYAEVELLPLDRHWRYGLFRLLPPNTDANKAVVAAITKLRDEAAAHDND